MSRRRALWAPGQLQTWDWKAAIIEERQHKNLRFEPWLRPDHGRPRGREDGPPISPSLILAWVGFGVAGLTALVFALSSIYGQMVAALTGVPAPVGATIGILLISAAGGLTLGAIGVTFEWRRRHRRSSKGRAEREPDNSRAG